MRFHLSGLIVAVTSEADKVDLNLVRKHARRVKTLLETPSPEKAKQMLKDKKAHGKRLTKKQKRLFQAVAHGFKPTRESEDEVSEHGSHDQKDHGRNRVFGVRRVNAIKKQELEKASKRTGLSVSTIRKRIALWSAKYQPREKPRGFSLSAIRKRIGAGPRGIRLPGTNRRKGAGKFKRSLSMSLTAMRKRIAARSIGKVAPGVNWSARLRFKGKKPRKAKRGRLGL